MEAVARVIPVVPVSLVATVFVREPARGLERARVEGRASCG